MPVTQAQLVSPEVVGTMLQANMGKLIGETFPGLLMPSRSDWRPAEVRGEIGIGEFNAATALSLAAYYEAHLKLGEDERGIDLSLSELRERVNEFGLYTLTPIGDEEAKRCREQISLAVTRHLDTLALARKRYGIPADAVVLRHVDDGSVLAGEHVFGYLPCGLAREALSVTFCPLEVDEPLATQIRTEGRGLTEAELRRCLREPVTYGVRHLGDVRREDLRAAFAGATSSRLCAGPPSRRPRRRRRSVSKPRGARIPGRLRTQT